MIRYPAFVDVDKVVEISEKSGEYRYQLEIPFRNAEGKKPILVILKNPSKASRRECDVTISKVCNSAYKNGYGKVFIFNLFPYRSTDPGGVYGFIQSPEYGRKMERNREYIAKCVKTVDEVVFAWGRNSISGKKEIGELYKQAQECVQDICKGKNWLMVDGGTREPLHGQRWRNDSEFVQWRGV